MLASGSFAPVQAADLPTGVDHQRSDPALVSFSYVRNHSACPTEDRQPRPQTVATRAVNDAAKYPDVDVHQQPVTSSATGQLVAPTGRLHELVNGR